MNIPLLIDEATGEPLLNPQGQRLAALQIIVPGPMLAAIGQLCGATGCVTPEGEPAVGDLIMRALRLVGLLSERKARGDERVTVIWNNGAPQPSGIVLAQTVAPRVAGIRSAAPGGQP